MALRKIREFGDEVLNKECKEVTKMTIRTKVLINDMLDTMYEAMGVGLAAPQVGILKRIVVIDIGEGPIHPDQSGNHRDIRRTDRRRRMFKPSRKSRNCYKTELRKGKSIE